MFVRPVDHSTVRCCVLSLLMFASTAQAAPKAAEAGAAAADAGAVNANWPQWRGPLGSGLAPLADPPTTWGEDKNVRWKVKLPGRASSTPIVWGDSIFVQTAVAADGAAERPAASPPPAPERDGPGGPGGRRGRGGVSAPTSAYKFILMCLDRRTGKPRW